jgi:high-affinity nickel permease
VISAEAIAQRPSISLISVLALGFFLGMRHATDADHVVAVSTIVSRERRVTTAALIGCLWGLGHTITILAVGACIILFSLVIPPRLGLSMELSVGLMLIFLGALNLLGFKRLVNERVSTVHGTDKLDLGKAHAHDNTSLSMHIIDSRIGRWPIYQWLRPLVVGLVHGLAGSAAVALLVLATLRDPVSGVAYLLVFGVGTIAGMMVITMMMASTLKLAGSRSEWVNRRLALGTGIVSIAFGIFVVYQMGYVHGLFTAHPTWTPS